MKEKPAVLLVLTEDRLRKPNVCQYNSYTPGWKDGKQLSSQKPRPNKQSTRATRAALTTGDWSERLGFHLPS